MSTEQTIRDKYEAIRAELDERARRLWAAAEVKALGHGGLACVARATGLNVITIRSGIRELAAPASVAPADRRVRRAGGGRRRVVDRDPGLLTALDNLVEPTASGDPSSPLRWTCKSTRRLAAELKAQGHPVSHTKVMQLLREMGYSLQGTNKAIEGASNPDRNAQFQYIYRRIQEFQRSNEPVISVDTKKKELVGDFANKGREYRPHGEPIRVRTHDFPDKELGKAIPYGIYDQTDNSGWVSVGTDHDTAEFAVESIRRWWYEMGSRIYPEATKLLITADCGGSNGYRLRLWKHELQRLADEIRLTIRVSHFPPGTSKWNKIEHRMFSHVSQNWRGRPLTSHEVIVNLIANTTTRTGLKIEAELDEGEYPLGIKVSDEQMKELRLWKARFHGEWNYSLRPKC